MFMLLADTVKLNEPYSNYPGQYDRMYKGNIIITPIEITDTGVKLKFENKHQDLALTPWEYETCLTEGPTKQTQVCEPTGDEKSCQPATEKTCNVAITKLESFGNLSKGIQNILRNADGSAYSNSTGYLNLIINNPQKDKDGKYISVDITSR